MDRRVPGHRRLLLTTPAWLHTFAEVGTDAGLFLFAALFVVAAVRAWRGRRVTWRS
ncbi:hypothetical protein ACFQ0B_00100 [Nonomuraea thailandensis]